MKNISLIFTVHQPVTLKRYRFFDIGNDSYYYDDYDNERKIRIIADECYLPDNDLLLKLLTRFNGRFKVSFSVSGTAIDLFRLYAPEVIRSFQQIASAEGVEFVAETYSHSLASLKNQDEFRRQIERHVKKITELFGKRPRTFINTEFIYSDSIGDIAAEEGFNSILAEEAGQIQGWRGPNCLYRHRVNSNMKILFQNSAFSNHAISFILNSDQKSSRQQISTFFSPLNKIRENENTINLCIDYEIARHNTKCNGQIFSNFELFLTSLAESKEINLKTLSEQSKNIQPVSEINVPDPYDAAEKSQSFVRLQGNELQQEALDKLYSLKYRINEYTDHDLWKDWQYLQSSDHFYYMSSRFFSDGYSDQQQNPYNNPYEAFINYMNILSDFTIRLNNIPTKKIGFKPHIFKSKRKIAAVS